MSGDCLDIFSELHILGVPVALLVQSIPIHGCPLHEIVKLRLIKQLIATAILLHDEQ